LKNLTDSDFLDEDDSLPDIQEPDTSASDIDEVITILINVNSDEAVDTTTQNKFSYLFYYMSRYLFTFL
jgi:hypothetical protein